MIVFWASWCGPCLNEVPILKKIHTYFKGKRVAMISVSLDTDKDAWINKLKTLDMPWSQGIVTHPAETKAVFNLDGNIPFTLITNGKGEILQKFIGFNVSAMEEYRKVILANLGV